MRRLRKNLRQETALSLERKAQIEMILLFREVVANYELSERIESFSQDEELMRYLNAEKFAELKEIPDQASPEEVDRIARAFWCPPYEMAYCVTPSGAKIEAIPDIVKEELAAEMHQEDLKEMLSSIDLLKTPAASVLDNFTWMPGATIQSRLHEWTPTVLTTHQFADGSFCFSGISSRQIS